jgi:hypothetical protein
MEYGLREGNASENDLLNDGSSSRKVSSIFFQRF